MTVRLYTKISIHLFRNVLTCRACMQVYDYYAGGADTESTVRDNRAVYGRYRLLPRYMVDVSHCDLTYRLLGKSPVARLHLQSKVFAGWTVYMLLQLTIFWCYKPTLALKVMQSL